MNTYQKSLKNILDLDGDVVITVEDSVLELVFAASFMVQRVVYQDGIYSRIINVNGDAVVVRQCWLSKTVEEVDRRYAEEELHINFNSTNGEIFGVRRTLH